MPGPALNTYIAAITEAERLCGEPPRIADISAVLLAWNSVWTPVKQGIPLHYVVMCILREDLLWTDCAKYYRFSTRPHKGYFFFSEAMRMNCPNFEMDSS